MKRLILLTLILTLSSCALFQKRTEYVYIKPSLPKQKVYTVTTPYDFGTLVNKEGKVCVQSWEACIPKAKFKELLDFLRDHKSTLKLSNDQAKRFNYLIEELKNTAEWKNARND